MVRYTTGDAGPHGRAEPADPVPVPTDPVAELDASVRRLLREVNAAVAEDEDLVEFSIELKYQQERWRTQQARIQQIFAMLGIIRRSLR